MRLPFRIVVWSFCGLAPLTSSRAQAAAPGSWSVGIERVFGFSTVTVKTTNKVTNQTTSNTSSQISLLDHTLSQQIGYPSARLALDYLFPSGLSLGGAIGYQSRDPDDEVDDNDVSSWLLAPRIGYFASVTGSFGVWPRGGLSYVSVDNGGDNEASLTAITLEVPLVLNVGGNVCFVGMPYVDLGVGGGNDDFDQKATEFGLQFGLSAFF
ncbi:MAG: hypothetical protein ABI895_01810 [Deltaproteobacteria bacterium]